MENLFETVNDKLVKDITGWKVLGILNKDSFILTEDEVIEINKFVPFDKLLKTNEDLWITSFYIKVISLDKDDTLSYLILVSPECPDQYINFDELKSDILDPIKDIIKYEYLTDDIHNKILKSNIDSIIKTQQIFNDNILRTNPDFSHIWSWKPDDDSDFSSIIGYNGYDSTTVTTLSSINNEELLNNSSDII